MNYEDKLQLLRIEAKLDAIIDKVAPEFWETKEEKK